MRAEIVTSRLRTLQAGVVVAMAVALLGAFALGATVRVAQADNSHVTCVLHGLFNGTYGNDSSYFGRVYPGCSSTARGCGIYSYGVLRGWQTVNDSTTTCNAWSQNWGTYTECQGAAGTTNPGIFSEHSHASTEPC
jgi:hypothetical protein